MLFSSFLHKFMDVVLAVDFWVPRFTSSLASAMLKNMWLWCIFFFQRSLSHRIVSKKSQLHVKNVAKNSGHKNMSYKKVIKLTSAYVDSLFVVSIFWVDVLVRHIDTGDHQSRRLKKNTAAPEVRQKSALSLLDDYAWDQVALERPKILTVQSYVITALRTEKTKQETTCNMLLCSSYFLCFYWRACFFLWMLMIVFDFQDCLEIWLKEVEMRKSLRQANFHV